MIDSKDLGSLDFEIEDEIMDEITSRYHSITELVNSAYWDIKSDKINGFILNPSAEDFKNGTVNMAAVLPKGIYEKFNFGSWNCQAVLLKEFTGKLKRRYRDAVISEEENSVIIPFSKVSFNVIPVFKDEDSLFFANGSGDGSWDYLDTDTCLYTID